MQRFFALTAIALVTSIASASVYAACPFPADIPAQMTTDAVQARWTTEPQPVQVGEPFALLVSLCPANAQLLRVDASMPEHRHGMNYRPSIQAIGPGQWRVEGLVWHMAGRWKLQLDTALAGQPHTLTQSLTLQ
ncbi:hypothetical protein [Hydrogenophaga sp.]|uniref:hypothetical protein n=1 Tax=Hydrogenophaga sp. TaxID=1904254 RepID=UPI0025BAD896|nr:hypothetical protein [Hydrogenophaga sp.]